MNKPVNHAELPFTGDETPESGKAVLISTEVETALARIEAKIAASQPEQFDWTKDESVILHDQPATAVYFNPEGSLVIRQEQAWDRDDDTCVFVTKQNQQAFLDRLCDALGIGSAP